jgi:ABC-type phosphate/phosphonate transport system substrate-binding protein
MFVCRHLPVGLVLTGLALAIGALELLRPAGVLGDDKTGAGKVAIGISESFFRDVPPARIPLVLEPFRALLEAQTGLSGQADVVEPQQLCPQMADGKLHFGVFQGFEFAWARLKHADLKPFVIAVHQDRTPRACLVVHRDSRAASLADLKGKTLALPCRTRGFCHLFLERECLASDGTAPRNFFSRLIKSADLTQGLNNVVAGTADGVVVDNVCLEGYRRHQPQHFERLKVIQQSEPFPAAVIAYRVGGLEEKAITRLQEGLLTASRSQTGQELLGLCQITRFEKIPADYEDTLAAIAKTYPPPKSWESR